MSETSYAENKCLCAQDVQVNDQCKERDAKVEVVNLYKEDSFSSDSLASKKKLSKSGIEENLSKSSSDVQIKDTASLAESSAGKDQGLEHCLGPTKPGNWRSSSDGSSKIITEPRLLELASSHLSVSDRNVSRRRSESDSRTEALKAKIEDKFEKLQQELQDKAKHNCILNSTTKTNRVSEDVEATGALLFRERSDHLSEEHSEESDVVKSGKRILSVAEVKEHAFARLQEELRKAQEELKLKDEEVARLCQIRDEVGAELEELTASLFEEAHSMVREANIRHAKSEKLLIEANLKNDVIQAEVQALKTLVITSTPSMPNHHLHPQLTGRHNGVNAVLRSGHKRSPSNYELASQTESPPCSPIKGASTFLSRTDNLEVDPVCHEEFVSWRKNPHQVKTHPFLMRIYKEDIWPCLRFSNEQLAKEVLKAIEDNSIVIEAVSSKTPFPKKCCLLEIPRLCKYRMKLGEEKQWYYLSQLCRNRIAAVCEFFCYLRYIQQGLVKSGIHEVYWEVMRRRQAMAMARLGLSLP
ncbi:guanine nucleotide exchange factor for Rab-3A-like isoform X1 [Limulus polyphemus]|uniref:Guanine nucleotide exchange factor for Rab-3A-like isoform X1 n=1 Tax=Limulus polyphemus TaxID=6850 RepID=A0ABM1SGY5_LIMPO|nr:guanine nucleotide exchange factor for Rab-3A-like isoform X1 [Limulus polyphemus]XP_022242900.1 guanine nucleotide exchange factor for Rab-3A-like isoform X1 [Limulus polyphemus]XP_022242910.1 guanine nucleotide exchange factor for Rab-3A-like isoform X1 [Limulus polyphemus]XP_022242915.1 guanine nucleotide exchange factor for Rab-3A-like isoform X1 [Limulus polyphemus]XP_022242921.1 guanine nucleotide exchange factor for Rab-3A-like isoform X1 [Limulus polyphemus]